MIQFFLFLLIMSFLIWITPYLFIGAFVLLLCYLVVKAKPIEAFKRYRLKRFEAKYYVSEEFLSIKITHYLKYGECFDTLFFVGCNMALSAFLNVNGYNFPCPRVGFQYTISTVVDAGRNVSGAVIGQRIGRDLFKLDQLQFACLDPETRMMILRALEPFYVPVTFENYRTGKPITITMYPGDRTGKSLFADKLTHMITMDETLAFNLIDCGLE